MIKLYYLNRSTLGKRLRERRKALGLTQVATASRLGVPLHTLTNWETGHANPRSLAYVRRILDFLESLELEPPKTQMPKQR